MRTDITLSEKRDILIEIEQGRGLRQCWGAMFRDMLRREIEREEAEARGKLPSLTYIESRCRYWARSEVSEVAAEQALLAAAEIVKLVREAHAIAGTSFSAGGLIDDIAQHARLE